MAERKKPEGTVSAAATETRGRKTEYTPDDPKKNMTVVLKHSIWKKLKVIAAKRETTVSQMITDWAQTLEE